MECDHCGNPIVNDDGQFCSACEGAPSGRSSTSECYSTRREESAYQLAGDDESSNDTPASTGRLTYIYRFALANTVQSGIFALAFVWLLNSPVVMTRASTGFGAHYQFQSFGLVYLVFLGVFALAFGAVAAGLWKRNQVFWYIGVTINALMLLLALIPRPTWWWVFLCGLALYWGYRSYEPIQAIEDFGHPTPTMSVARQIGQQGSESSSTATASNGSHASMGEINHPDDDDVSTGSIVGGMVWMGVISLLLFWLPAFGSLIAGYVGGKKTKGVMRSLLAAILPAVIVGALIWIAVSLLNLPIIGAVLGSIVSLVIILHSLGLIAGAVIGGALS